MAERDSSPAYRALSPSARTVLALIERQVTHGGGVAAISFSDIESSCGITHGTCGFALRQVRLLGFVTVERGRPARLVNSFRLRRLADNRRGRGAPIGGAGTPVAIGSAAVPKPKRSNSRRWRTSRLATCDDGAFAIHDGVGPNRQADARSFQFGLTSPPIAPQTVQTMRGTEGQAITTSSA